MDFYFDTAYSTKYLRIDRVGEDSWLSKNGACGSWTRLHMNPRSARFMPCKVVLRPKGPDKVGNVRITLGTSGWSRICWHRRKEEFGKSLCSEWETFDGMDYVRWCDVIVLLMRSLFGGFSANTALSRGGVFAHNEHRHVFEFLRCTFVRGNLEQYHL